VSLYNLQKKIGGVEGLVKALNTNEKVKKFIVIFPLDWYFRYF